MKIYLDVCCLNRPFDDQNQPRIRLESEAILFILHHFHLHDWEWLGSDALILEIDQTPNPERRNNLRLMVTQVHDWIAIQTAEANRSQQLEQLGFHAMDALHLASAESAEAHIFLTTDDKLLKLATRLSSQLQVKVANPIFWLLENL
jgi:hypothetical protein